MLKNFLITALRQFRKNPVYAGLNILGLAVGTACFVLILLWVENETGYDRALSGAERIYRVTTDVHLASGQNKFYAVSTSGLAVALKAEYPEVQASTRIVPSGQILLRSGEAAFFERNFVYVDSNFLEVFGFPLAEGDPSQVLKQPRSLLMTRATAERYFGGEDPVGKTVTTDNRQSYTVTGILEETGRPSHIRADLIANPGNAPFFNHPTWSALGIYTYIRLDGRTDPGAFEAKIQDLAAKYAGPRGKETFRYRLQPMTSIHLHSDREAEFATVVGVTQVRLLSAVAVMILLVACVNFVNLSTARAGTDLARTRASVEERMAALQPEYPPETFFLDAVLDGLYGNERRLGRIFKDFSLVTILVACMGLFGLAAYDAEQRTKEIGIRKVLGATVPDILWLLSRESAGLLVVANLVAWPVGYLLMNNWLRNFAYKTSIGPAVMAVSGALALAVALMTVSVQAFRAAVADPVESIRYE